MNRLEELKKKYAELGAEIEKLEKKESNAGKPENGERYFYMGNDGSLYHDVWQKYRVDEARYEMGNWFRTEEETEAVVEKIKIYTQLKRLAEEINTEPIDWGNYKQEKYSLYYVVDEECLDNDSASYTKTIGDIFSTNPNFLKIARERIGEENLLKLFKE